MRESSIELDEQYQAGFEAWCDSNGFDPEDDAIILAWERLTEDYN